MNDFAFAIGNPARAMTDKVWERAEAMQLYKKNAT